VDHNRSGPHSAERWPGGRRYSVTALFQALDGRTFHHYDDLIDSVLGLLNAHLTEFPSDYGYRDALAYAEAQGWLAAAADGRSVTVMCSAAFEAELAAMAA
jgi:hypothetical protein